MILETIVTTINKRGEPHIAPMGIHRNGEELLILPFRPSTTLDNMLETGCAVVNYCDDVRVFAGCLTGRRDWPLTDAETIDGKVLANTLAHEEVEVLHVDEDPVRPKLYCNVLHASNPLPFRGFNRAQFSVLEAAILVSRLGILPQEKIDREIDYLRIGLDKTAGSRELEAWSWLMEKIEHHRQGHNA
ncbi:MAG: DUF447 family protein [Methylomicrobium sp.]